METYKIKSHGWYDRKNKGTLYLELVNGNRVKITNSERKYIEKGGVCGVNEY